MCQRRWHMHAGPVSWVAAFEHFAIEDNTPIGLCARCATSTSCAQALKAHSKLAMSRPLKMRRSILSWPRWHNGVAAEPKQATI